MGCINEAICNKKSFFNLGANVLHSQNPTKENKMTGSYGIMRRMWNKCTIKLDRNSTAWITKKNPYTLHLQNDPT